MIAIATFAAIAFAASFAKDAESLADSLAVGAIGLAVLCISIIVAAAVLSVLPADVLLAVSSMTALTLVGLAVAAPVAYVAYRVCR